jgi:hypothetical protein
VNDGNLDFFAQDSVIFLMVAHYFTGCHGDVEKPMVQLQRSMLISPQSITVQLPVYLMAMKPIILSHYHEKMGQRTD